MSPPEFETEHVPACVPAICVLRLDEMRFGCLQENSGCLHRSCRVVAETNQGHTTIGGWSDTVLQSELILAWAQQGTTLTFCNLC